MSLFTKPGKNWPESITKILLTNGVKQEGFLKKSFSLIKKKQQGSIPHTKVSILKKVSQLIYKVGICLIYMSFTINLRKLSHIWEFPVSGASSLQFTLPLILSPGTETGQEPTQHQPNPRSPPQLLSIPPASPEASYHSWELTDLPTFYCSHTKSGGDLVKLVFCATVEI